MSSIAPKYKTYYLDKNYGACQIVDGACQIVDYDFYNYPYVYKVIILAFDYNKGYIATEKDIKEIITIKNKRNKNV